MADRHLEILLRIEGALGRIEGRLDALEHLDQETRLRGLELGQEGMRHRVGFWGGISGIAAALGTLVINLM